MLKRNIARFFLKKKVDFSSKRKRTEHFSFNKVKTVGIVFTAYNTYQLDEVVKYIKLLTKSGKDVKSLCFFKAKELPNLKNTDLQIDFLSVKDINLFNIPKSASVDSFIENKFDLLINLNTSEDFTTEYISSLSDALFKVGRYSEHNEYIFDMMIEMDTSKSVNYFIEQISIYLKMINKAA